MMHARAFLGTMLLLLFPGAAARANDESPARIDEVVVTPGRKASPTLALPFGVGVVPGESLSGPLAPRSLTEAAAELSGVLPQKTGHGQGSPFLRGLTGFRTLLLVDGIRLNNSVFRDGPNQYFATIDHLSLGSLEMVGGPASVLYGSDALGGVLNALPRLPLLDREADRLGARLYQRVSTAEGGGTARLEAEGSLDGAFAFLLGAARKSFHDLRDGKGRLPYTGYDEWDMDARILHDTGAGLRFTFGFARVSQDGVPRTHRTMHAVPFDGTTVGSDRAHEYDQMRGLGYVRMETLEPMGFAKEMRVTASCQRQRELRFRVRKDRRSDRQGFTVDTLGLDATVVSRSAIGTLTYGLDWYHDFVDSFARSYSATGELTSRGVQGPVADDAAYDLAGVFVQDEIDLGADVTATVGLRGTLARARAGRVQDAETGGRTHLSDQWSSPALSARLSWLAAEETSLWAGVSQGFRAPNLSDLTRLDVARTNEIEVPNTDLDPEHALAFEAGARTRAGPVQGEVVVFHTLLRDFIQRRPTDRTIDGDVMVEKSNCGDGALRGIEASGEVDLGAGFTAYAGGAYFYGKIDSYASADSRKNRDYIDRLPPLMGRAGLRCEPVAGLLLDVRARFAGHAGRLSPGDRADTERIPPHGTPSWGVLDLRISCEALSGVTLSLALENVLNETYRIHGSGLNEPGRNLSLTLEARF
ncbi:MAG: TonB-dependent receptor [Planctomycetes bacterium]|jgi:hemoglobin/transferrin/lactoferrin receptor protein|nr:TonB-dependent receptor [Planctomycetota bacterium]